MKLTRKVYCTNTADTITETTVLLTNLSSCQSPTRYRALNSIKASSRGNNVPVLNSYNPQMSLMMSNKEGEQLSSATRLASGLLKAISVFH
jgi:hypothetical protein